MEAKAVVRQALEILTPAMPGRMEDGNVCIVKFMSFEPPRGKPNNVVSEQVRHKPACTNTENS